TYDVVTGTHTDNPNLFSLVCRGSAIDRCNWYGYPSWQSRVESYNALTAVRSLDNYHFACVRMICADYCGDGQAHTRSGTAIDIDDNLNLNVPLTSSDGSDGWYFEAEWGVDGAWCINKTRLMSDSVPPTLAYNQSSVWNSDWAYIESHCPERIAGR